MATRSEEVHGEFYDFKKWQRKRSCEQKQFYLSEGQALRAAIKLRKTPSRGEHLTPYQCTFCGLWHLGHGVIDRKIEEGKM